MALVSPLSIHGLEIILDRGLTPPLQVGARMSWGFDGSGAYLRGP
jgi:hypothetical protein